MESAHSTGPSEAGASAGSDLQYHIRCRRGDVGSYALLPGDPGRCAAIARLFDQPRLIAVNREYTTWSGSLAGELVSVTSTGIGGPSTAIAVEELAALGTHTAIRVGTCGAIQPQVHKGDLIVATAAVRDEGTSGQYMPVEYPAVATHEVVDALLRAASTGDRTPHLGVVQSKDAFYAQTRPDAMPIAAALHERWRAWVAGGVLASEMECATIFTVAAVLGIRSGGILLCINEPPYVATGSRIEELPLDALIGAAIGGLRGLIASDQTRRNHHAAFRATEE